MARPQMKRVLSSAVFEIGYAADDQQLWVRFSPSVKNPAGAIGFYSGVPAEVADGVTNSPSIGSALNDQVKRVGYAFQYA